MDGKVTIFGICLNYSGVSFPGIEYDMTIFDKEQWKIVKDTEPRNYCGVVPNLVKVNPARGKSYAVYIKIPSDLFDFFKNVLQISVGDMEQNPVMFFLDAYADTWYLVAKLPNNEEVDLWAYKGVPPWALKVV